MVLRQSCGNSVSGLSSVSISGCLNGLGTPEAPLTVRIDPTGLLSCGAAGIRILNAPSITTTGCFTGVGTVASPLGLYLNATGGIHCTISGLALQNVYLTQVVTSGCFDGIGTVGSPMLLKVNPTGLIQCTPNGIAFNGTTGILNGVSVVGCISGNGLTVPLQLTIDPTGLLSCGPAGVKLLNAPVASVSVVGCLSGSGTPGSPLSITVNATGGLQCTSGGLALQNVYLTQVITSGCFDGIGTVGSPLLLKVDPTGYISCGPNGVKLLNAPTGTGITSVLVSGCLAGSGITGSPITITLNPTGNINCTPSGLALRDIYLTQVVTSGCFDGIGTVGSPLLLRIDPTGLIGCGASGLRYLGPTGGGVTSPALPFNSVQFNDGGTFGGSSGLIWDSSGLILSSYMPTTGVLMSVGRNVDVSPLLSLTQYSNFISARHATVRGEGLYLEQDSTSNRLALMGQFGIRIASTLSYGFSDSSSGIATLDVTLLRDAADTLALRRLTNPQAFNIYNTYVNAADYERAVIDWKGSPGVLRIGTEQLGNGAARPVDIMTSGTSRINIAAAGDIQFNGAYTFPQTIGTSGQTLIRHNNSTLIWGLPSVQATGCITGSGTVLTPLSLKIDPTGLIACGVDGLKYIGPTGSVGGLPAAPNTSIQFNDGGVFGGSSKMLWDGSTIKLSGAINVSGAILTSDNDNALAQRNATTAQTLRIYNTRTNASNYERATIDWAGSPGLLQIGTEQAGTGLARGLALLTSGVARIDITEQGSVQFNGAYTFPTGIGNSGETFIRHNNSTLIWGLPSVRATGCITGSGTAATPLQVQLNPTGLLHCTPLGLAYNGPTGVSAVSVTGCITGSGTPASPISVVLNPTGLINCTPAGLALKDIYLTQVVTSGCLDGIGTVGSPLLLKIDPTGLIACGVDGLKYIGPTGSVGGLPAAPNTSIQFNDGGVFGGSSKMLWNGTTIGLSGSINISGAILVSDEDNVLAQRNSTTAQAFRVYNTRTNASNYERAVIDWAGSPGILQIGTQQAGTGSARGLQILTSGVARIDVTEQGSIQFNQAYTFPTGIGTSGQTLIRHNNSTLIWGLPSVRATGCITGSGTVATPLQIQLNPTGLLHCTPLGLAYNGPTGVNGDGSGITFVTTTGCIAGSGTPASPISISLNPTGGIACGPNGLHLSSSGMTYIVTSTCLAGSGTAASPARVSINPTGFLQCTPLGLAYNGPTGITGVMTAGCLVGNGTVASPVSVSLNSTGLINCTSNGLAFGGPTGILFNGVQTFGCISGNGLTNSVGLKVDPTGLLTCGNNGIRLSNAPGGSSNKLHLDLTGLGTHANPITAADLTYNNGSSGVTIDYRPLIFFSMGQAGALVVDDPLEQQPKFIVPEGYQVEICRAYITLGTVADTDTVIQLQRYLATTDCTLPTTNGTAFEKTVVAGCNWERWTEFEGITFNSLQQLSFRVLTPGNNGANLSVQFWAKVTVCFEHD